MNESKSSDIDYGEELYFIDEFLGENSDKNFPGTPLKQKKNHIFKVFLTLNLNLFLTLNLKLLFHKTFNSNN